MQYRQCVVQCRGSFRERERENIYTERERERERENQCRGSFSMDGRHILSRPLSSFPLSTSLSLSSVRVEMCLRMRCREPEANNVLSLSQALSHTAAKVSNPGFDLDFFFYMCCTTRDHAVVDIFNTSKSSSGTSTL